MPKLNSLSPAAWGALELRPFAFTFGFGPYRLTSTFRAGPAHRLLAQANRAKLPVFPTLPSLFQGGATYLTDANYVPGARGNRLQSTSATRGLIWVSAKKPWLRTGFLPRVPRTVVVTSAATWGGSLTPVATEIDTAWDAYDDGGWEVAVLGQADDPFWGLPILDTDFSVDGIQGDFSGYFGELVLCRVHRADLSVYPFDYIPVGNDLDGPPPDDPVPDAGEVNDGQVRYTVPVEYGSVRASITSVADDGGEARVTTTTTDGLLEEELIRVTGTGGVYDGEWKVLGVTATEFTLADPDTLDPVPFDGDATGGWRRRTNHRLVWVRYTEVLLDSGPPFYAQVASNYNRFRHVVVTGDLSDYEITETDPTTVEWDIQNLYYAIRKGQELLSPASAVLQFTGQPATHLSVPFLPDETFDQRAAAALAAWLAANLNG